MQFCPREGRCSVLSRATVAAEKSGICVVHLLGKNVNRAEVAGQYDRDRLSIVRFESAAEATRHLPSDLQEGRWVGG